MAGKPRGEKALTNAERQKRYRDRQKPKDIKDKFRRDMLRAAQCWQHFLSTDEIEFWLRELGLALQTDEYLTKQGRKPYWVDRYLSGGSFFDPSGVQSSSHSPHNHAS